MRLKKARVMNYRSIRDTGWFDVERDKTIMVGPNEAGKTVILQALQQINPPGEVPKLDPLRDYPRASYNDITTGVVKPADVTVVEAHFSLDSAEQAQLPEAFRGATYVFGRRLDNSYWHSMEGGPSTPTYKDLENDLARLWSHIDPRLPENSVKLSEQVKTVTAGWTKDTLMDSSKSKPLRDLLERHLQYIDESLEAEERRYNKVRDLLNVAETRNEVISILAQLLPVFVLFNNYIHVKPIIHLGHLVTRVDNNVLDDAQYDYGNLCLLKLLGFTPHQLSELGRAAEPSVNNTSAFKTYRDQLDKRSYQLNAASVRLTDEVRSVWVPDATRAEADKLRLNVDGQYLKVVVEDSHGVEVELDQRSQGFQWLVSFFIVFFAEAQDKHKNAILLLDEPGLSLHGLKQREFRSTISKLAQSNQTLYTTHSPFLVGPDELDMVRVVEMTDRKAGTKVHTTVTASDPAAMLPLQEALGYDLAQSLFVHKRNLILEGLTDYWYLEAMSEMLHEAKEVSLLDTISLLPACSASKIVYYATFLHANSMRVAALLDSDSAGDQAAQQETLIHTLGNKGVIRTKDAYIGPVKTPEIEDLLRDTLVTVAKAELSWDVSKTATQQPARPIVDVFTAEITDFSKYRLAKAFLRWARTHGASDLQPHEVKQCTSLITRINKALK